MKNALACAQFPEVKPHMRNNFRSAASTARRTVCSATPSSPITIFFCSVASLSTFTTDSVFRPFASDADMRTSNGFLFSMREDMNATMQSSPREACSMRAGRTFWPERSVKGNGMRTMRPLDIALLQIGSGIDIGLALQKIEASGIYIHIRDIVKRRIIESGESNEHCVNRVAPADSKNFAAVFCAVNDVSDALARAGRCQNLHLCIVQNVQNCATVCTSPVLLYPSLSGGSEVLEAEVMAITNHYKYACVAPLQELPLEFSRNSLVTRDPLPFLTSLLWWSRGKKEMHLQPFQIPLVVLRASGHVQAPGGRKK